MIIRMKTGITEDSSFSIYIFSLLKQYFTYLQRLQIVTNVILCMHYAVLYLVK